MPLTHHPHGMSSFGVPMFGNGGLIPVPGNVYFVNQETDGSVATYPGSDSNSGEDPRAPLAKLSAAHDKMKANQNDTVIVIGSTASIGVRETDTLAWSKDCCHIIGAMANNKVSQRVSIRAASGSTFTPLVNVTADGCTFANFHCFHGYDDNSAQICWDESGQRNAHFNLHLGGMGHQTAADHTGGRSLKLSGDGERYFEGCVIGIDTIDRGAANAQIELASQAVRDIFENCRVISRADATSPLFVTIGASGLDRFVEFSDCAFHNHGTSLTQAMSVSNTAGGSVLLRGAKTILVGADEWDSNDNAYINLPAAASTGGEGTTVADT